ncbi:hypothetical protein QUF64_05640 [Anaerolineales bacterium HSG6]|nr:hypothetical protein [Anaerolineales bacterium HSG6]
MQITTPAGATEDPFVLDHTANPITASTHAPPAGYSMMHGFNLDTFIKGVLQSGFVFNRPITMTINYTDQQVAQFAKNTLHVRYWDVSEQTWKTDGIVTISHDTDKNQFIITIAHLTEFGLFGGVEAKGNTVYLPVMMR